MYVIKSPQAWTFPCPQGKQKEKVSWKPKHKWMSRDIEHYWGTIPEHLESYYFFRVLQLSTPYNPHLEQLSRTRHYLMTTVIQTAGYCAPLVLTRRSTLTDSRGTTTCKIEGSVVKIWVDLFVDDEACYYRSVVFVGRFGLYLGSPTIILF